ncbi:multicopper oxidase domain-containing protein [Streptomyces sp. NPDC002851]
MSDSQRGIMSRRGLLTTLGGVGAGGALMGVGGWARAGLNDTPMATSGIGAPLRDLPEVRSRSGLLDHTLTVAAARPAVGGRRLHLDTYDGQLPGVLLRIRPGDQVRLELRNRMLPTGVPLNALPPVCADEAQAQARDHGVLDGAPHCLPEAVHGLAEDHTVPQQAITTNLHTHGLQVSPAGPADNVFVRVGPLGSHQYVYAVPDDHPAGLHWYHPHHHGSTTHQAWSGLAGPIVVEGDLDAVPEIADMRERTIVINALRIDGNGENPTALVLPTGGDDPFTTVPAVPTDMLFPLNGQLRPVASIRPGET